MYVFGGVEEHLFPLIIIIGQTGMEPGQTGIVCLFYFAFLLCLFYILHILYLHSICIVGFWEWMVGYPFAGAVVGGTFPCQCRPPWDIATLATLPTHILHLEACVTFLPAFLPHTHILHTLMPVPCILCLPACMPACNSGLPICRFLLPC